MWVASYRWEGGHGINVCDYSLYGGRSPTLGPYADGYAQYNLSTTTSSKLNLDPFTHCRQHMTFGRFGGRNACGRGRDRQVEAVITIDQPWFVAPEILIGSVDPCL